MNSSLAISPSPGFNRVALSETTTLTHSGGTAPVSHRTSLLGPIGRLSFRLYAALYADCKQKNPGVLQNRE
jgi:hypothetical protein